MFLPVIPADVGQSLAEEWIRAGQLQEKVASSWPKVKQREFDPIDEVPPLD